MRRPRKFIPIWLFGLLAFLTACGLSPVHRPQATEALAQIRVLPMADREGQILRTALQQALDPQGRNLPPVYEFTGTSTTAVALLLPEESVVRSARGTMTLTGTLHDQDGNVLWSGTLSASALFAQHQLPSVSGDAQERLWQDLSAQLARDLVMALSPIF